MKRMLPWILALLLTLTMAVYQRLTGPTHPVSGRAQLDGQELSYKFARSHSGAGDQPVSVHLGDAAGPEIAGTLRYRRFGTGEDWVETAMTRSETRLTAFLPHQPPAGKLVFQVELRGGGEPLVLPAAPIVTRFRSDVPPWWLIPHVIFMFAALMLSVRTGLGLLTGEDPTRLVVLSAGFLFAGGMILGPVVQKFAFGAFWTGWPFGGDLTDNKTLLAMIFWGLALLAVRYRWKVRLATAAAVVVMLAVYMIPHSMWGSSYDYESGQVSTGRPTGA